MTSCEMSKGSADSLRFTQAGLFPVRAGDFPCRCQVLHLVCATRVRAFLQLDFFSCLFVFSFFLLVSEILSLHIFSSSHLSCPHLVLTGAVPVIARHNLLR